MNERIEAVWLEPGDVFVTDDEPDSRLYYDSHQRDDDEGYVLACDEDGNNVSISSDEMVTRVATA